MWVVTYFNDGTVGITGLSPIIRIRDISTGLVTVSGVMLDKGSGFYAYDFTGYDITTEYVVLCDAVTLSDINRYQSLTTGEYGDTINIIDLTADEVNFRIELIRKILQNKLELSDGDTNNLVIYDDDNVTERIKWGVTDVLDGPVVQVPYNTSKRSIGA